MALITDPDQLTDGTEITITTATRLFLLTITGNLSSDGVTLQAIYSFFKEDWKDDPFTKNLMAYPFPMVAITPEQFELVFDWEPTNDTTRKLIRTGGWKEIDTENGTLLKKEFVGVITLGTFEDAASDTVYYQTGDDPTITTSTTDMDLAGPVNEVILSYEENVPADVGTGFDFAASTITRQDGGDFIADGYRVGAQVTVLNATVTANDGDFVITAVTTGVVTVSGTPFTVDTSDQTVTFARNYRNAIKLFLRVRDADPNGKIFSQSTLSDIGVTEVTNQVYRFPLSNSTDLKVSETDANVSGNSPYTEILVRYFATNFSRDVDTPGIQRDFGIVIDVGTHSGIDGTMTSAGNTLTSAEGSIVDDTRYEDGVLIIHEGTNSGSYTIANGAGAVTATTIDITTTFSNTTSNDSFTIQRSTPVTASAEEIYEKVQYLLRQASDIDTTNGDVVTGKTADALLEFVGSDMKAGSALPNNPNGGGSGVSIEGFDSNDTNRISLFDNTGAERSFPFVAAGNISFNDNLINDTGPATYTMFFQYTSRTTVSDMALSGAAGSTASLDSAGTNLPTTTQNDYIALLGFTDPNNNGVWQITDATPTTAQADITKLNGDTVSNETGASRTLDLNPINSPDAIIVQDNSSIDITGTIGGSSISFDFDYDGNVQGDRIAATDAAIIIRAIGLNLAQFVETTGTITRATGLAFSLVAGLERNYANA